MKHSLAVSIVGNVSHSPWSISRQDGIFARWPEE
jgi:hypothetical protein